MSIVGQTAPANSQPAGALQASQAGPLVAQPSDGLSQMAPPSQGERQCSCHAYTLAWRWTIYALTEWVSQ